MAENTKYFSRNTLVAIYLLFRALRKGADRVQLTEAFFRSYFNCERPTRLYDAYIRDFGYSIKPFFTNYAYGDHNMMLYVKDRDKTQKYYESIVKIFEVPNTIFNRTKSRAYSLWRTEVIDALPEIDEELIAREVAECIYKYETIKSVIS